MEKVNQKWISRLIVVLLVLLILYMLVQLAPLLAPLRMIGDALLLPLGLSILLTYLLHPLVERLHEIGMRRSLAVLLIFVVISIGLALSITIGLPAIIKQVQHALETIPKQLKALQDASNEVQVQINSLPTPLQTQTTEWKMQLERLGSNVLDQVEAAALFLLKSVFSFLVIPFLVFFFLKDFELIKRVSWYLTPRKWRKPLQRYVKDVDHTFGNYIRGQLLVSLSVAILTTIGLWFLGVPFPLLLGLFMGAMDLIPFFGPFIGAVPAVLLAFLESWKLGLFTVIFIFVIQQIEGNILSPVIVGKTLHLHPATIILALLIGVEIGGFFGMLIAVPVLGIGKVTLLHARAHFMND